MTGLATCLANQFGRFDMDPRVRAGRKDAGDVGVTIEAGTIANIGCSGDLGRGDNSSREGGTGIEQERAPSHQA